MKIDISRVPFARAGSFMTFGVLPSTWGHVGLVMRTMHRGLHHEVFHLKLMRDGADIPYIVEATTSLATLTPVDGSPGKVEICLPETEVARFRITGDLRFRLRSLAVGKSIFAYPLGDGWVNINASANKVQYQVIPHRGTLQMEMPVYIGDHPRTQKKKDPNAPKPVENPLIADWLPDDAGVIEFVMHEFIMSPRLLTTLDFTFEECQRATEEAWAQWEATTPEVPERYEAGARQAAYVNYASTVGSWGFLKRPTTLMSRNWMTSCWSWDHCFNAIAYAPHQPETAWDQLNVHFHLQEPAGCLPDGVNLR